MADRYVICGYDKNPACEDGASEKPDHVMDGKNKNMAIGAAKIMLDNFSCGYIEIFKVKGEQNEPNN